MGSGGKRVTTEATRPVPQVRGHDLAHEVARLGGDGGSAAVTVRATPVWLWLWDGSRLSPETEAAGPTRLVLTARLRHHPWVFRSMSPLTRSIRPRLAILLIAAALLPAAPPAAAWRPALGKDAARVGPALSADELKPRIVSKFIPFTKQRNQMTAYSTRHYGDHTYVLSDPQVIVRALHHEPPDDGRLVVLLRQHTDAR